MKIGRSESDGKKHHPDILGATSVNITVLTDGIIHRPDLDGAVIKILGNDHIAEGKHAKAPDVKNNKHHHTEEEPSEYLGTVDGKALDSDSSVVARDVEVGD